MMQPIQSGVLCLAALMTLANASPMVPFVIPVDIHPDSQIAMTWKPLTERDRLSAKDHFINQAGKRVRLWGVNLSFEANFPTHADAERIAKRMAAFGVNAVRCHHMDTAAWPRGIWDQTGRQLHPEAMDRLDYFINELAKHGIYTDLNLHVGKKHSIALALPDSITEFDKMVTIFTPELVEAQKDYARQLLTRKNSYRGNVTYAEDYAVAIVEITNENSLFMWGAENTLRTLPPFYADLLREKYNQWLKNKYQTQAALEKEWVAQSQPLGNNMLSNPTLTDAALKLSSWNLEQHTGCKASAELKEYKGLPALCITPTHSNGTAWHLQLNQGRLNLAKGQVYTIEFDVAAPAPRTLDVGVLQAHEPWANLGLHQSFAVAPDWKTYRTSFIADPNDTNARLSFYFGNEEKPFYLANVKLRPGVEYAIDPGETLETKSIHLFGQVESPRRKIDRLLFLAQTEKTYFDGMKAFIKTDLGCKAMVAGTIVFGPLGLYAQSDMDFIDSHAYWQHPQFPNKPWDPADWLIDQKAMSDYPEQGTLYELAAQRLSGKPFTVTEYNHPAPLDSQAQCVPMIASFAAAHDWDGVWLYTYSHSNNNWDREHLNSYFDIDTNPAKWGFMNSGSLIFREGYIEPLRTLCQGVSTFTGTEQVSLDQVAEIHLKVDRNMLAAVKSGLKQNIARQGGRFSVKADLQWDVVDAKGLYCVQNDSCIVLSGRTERFGIRQGGSMKIMEPEFAAVTMVSLDGKRIEESEKILITACRKSENTEMKFSEDRRTVGANWGKAPVLIEPVEGEIGLPRLIDFKWTCKTLKPDGTVAQTVECPNNIVPLKAEYGTMWYLVERTVGK